MPGTDRSGTPTQDESRADDVYQPAHSDGDNRPSGPLDPDNALATDPADDMSVPGYSPPDRPTGVTRHGTTQREQQEGEPLDDRLRQEEPEPQAPGDDGIGDLPGGDGEPVDEEAGAVRAGRLAPYAARPGHIDRAVARDIGPDDGTAPAEEAAMHVETAVNGVDEGEERDV
ncbi:hypothetical protein HHL19_35965 [Streptomyces sp. R302]|uniref:DUF5709 domain-containing protein n=1 Tax=unclassified Streptomyces TaxID=2593676 RepID=UPI00145EE8E4|nr:MULTISPECIES: DUF5709 domain-containing protein [unclassified Streptomyces]NML55476.1 hypothetical protein [Streptomyces sp. R301]NML83907.1 hypothetical protein [Streptomyces sp. R302]